MNGPRRGETVEPTGEAWKCPEEGSAVARPGYLSLLNKASRVVCWSGLKWSWLLRLLHLFQLRSQLLQLLSAESRSHLMGLQHQVEVPDLRENLPLLRTDLFGDHSAPPSWLLSSLTSASNFWCLR